MKKGFTMIELIFVIVILGILASVAIPRLAATREDAEISAAVANLRTLVSDVSAYYVVKGSFGSAKWNEITNVPLKDATKIAAGGSGNDGVITVGGQDCILLKIIEKGANGNTNGPTHILIAKQQSPTAVCRQVQEAEPLKAYFSSKVNGNNGSDGKGRVAIGSSTIVYPPAPKPTT
ncbi:MAG: type II secretion system protein [Campylobacter sp.]|uniref:type II secretion system protein n=1 Tax=Campylobacter sp. TaxID=205 RepID=UPI002A8080D1|nr:type II secretion system protein [Campylobacter sp.]MCI7587706.1 type II secretion system GspH family protein [Campylobacter sp.]MDY5115460.1 type II secretion system protein [Campylobacter sp.]